MKRQSNLKRWAVMAGVCLLLAAVLAASLGWTTASSSRPAAQPVAAQLARAGGESATSNASADSASRPSRFAETSKVSAQATDNPAEAVRTAWQRARDAGVYAFATDLVQASYPARTLANSGRGPQRYALHMEGEVDQPARTLEFRMWQPGMAPGTGDASSGTAPGGGAEARIEGDRAYLRPAGGEWKEVEDFSATFAPDNDPLAFLAGIKDIAECGFSTADSEFQSTIGNARNGGAGSQQFAIACYRFDMDGPAFASYMRDQLERQLAERGELPLNVTLDAPDSFRQMTGSGELWVDARGMPMRLALHLAFPEERNGAHLEADVQTAFSGFPEQVAAAPKVTDDPLTWAGSLLSQSNVNKASETGGTGGALACGLGAAALLLACRRSRRLYAAVVVAMILSMVVVPLMQSERAAAFFERRAAPSEKLMGLGSADQTPPVSGVAEQGQYVAENLVPTWDPHQDPLATPALANARTPLPASLGPRPIASSSLAPFLATPSYDLNCSQTDTGDPDNDGVNNYEECVYLLNSGEFDMDGDGLSDGQELNKLGTDPTRADTDGDFITDTVELRGFTYGDQTWYLNPNHPDSNGDGLMDSVECPVLVDFANPTESDFRNGCDSDQDGIPNVFANDNDGDGVPDKVDLSPDESLDINQKRFGQATAATAFHDDSPFLLSVAGLQEDWPVLVDLQMRPVIPTHLAYPMNVLDWPARDLDGQLQHWKSTTFKNSDNPDIKNPDDDPGANGDMRLVPLLEIVMTGAHVPLALTSLSVTAEVRGAISSTVTMTPNAANTDSVLAFKFANTSSYTVKIYNSSCPVSGNPATAFTGVTDAATRTYTGKKLVDLADGHHAMLVSAGSVQTCADIPNVVNGPYSDKMVDASALAPYQITVQDRDDGSVVAYVPLSVAPDDTGGGKSAFQAHMVYRPGENRTWDEPQQMRIIWLVQMITDSCNDDGFPLTEKDRQEDPAGYDEALHAWCDKKEHRTMDQLLPVQVYDESWYLTGLSVREDHGLDVAVASVNKDLATYNDDALWTLSWGLGQQFVTGRDCETWDATKGVCVGDNRRDLSVFQKDRSGRTIGNSTIEQRFDYTTTATLNQRWGIQANPFPLRVDSFRYDSVDYAGYLSTTETPRILKELQGKWGTGFYPTLLFAHEERFRSAFLSAAEMPPGGVLTVDISNTATYPEQTTAGMLWAPFRYNQHTGEWEGYPSSDYWSQLGEELKARFPAEPADTNAGQVASARAYYYALFAGVQGVIHCTPDELKCSTGDRYGSDATIASATTALGGLNHAAIEVVPEDLALKQHVETNDVSIDEERNGLYVNLDASLQAMKWSDAASLAAVAFNWLGQTVQGYAPSPYIVFRIGPAIPVDAGPLPGAAAISLDATLYAASQNLNPHDTAVRVFNALYMGSGYFSAALALRSINAAGGFAKAAEEGMGFIKNLKCFGGVLGVLITVGYVLILWGAFAIQWYTGSLTAGSMAWDDALMETITMTIVTIVLWVIFTCLGPIGDILNALKILINALIGLICSILPQEAQESNAADWICGGITGFLAKSLEALVYSGTLIVDIDPDDDKGPPWYPRLDLHDFEMDLVDPEAGVVTGNAMRYSARLTNTIDLSDVPLRRQELFWGWQFNDENLKNSTFYYRWQETEQDPRVHDPLSLGGMTESWLPTKGGRPYYYTETVATEGGFPLGAAGINRPVENLYFSEAYALPEQECWGFQAAKYCYIATEMGASPMNMGSGLFYDIFPPTLDGFYQLTRKADGYALAWGQKGNVTFPTLFDADGDGLARTDDQNDSKWDADDDGLSDVFELDFGSNPTEKDTDDDGLTDYQEAQFGSNPTSPDGDGDGLYDCEEEFHQVLSIGNENVRKVCGQVLNAWTGGWTIVYYGADPSTPLRTLVTSNPVEADTDGDGLTDHQEQIYGYNPRAYSSLNVLSLHTELGELQGTVTAPTDGFVAPGQTLHFEATVQNKLDDRQAEGLLSTVATPFLDMTKARDQSFNLGPQQQANLAGDLKVLASSASGTYSLTQVAGALIANLTAETDQAALWLRFDDPAAPYVDWSDSLTPHNGACFDQNGASATACVQEPAGGRIGGGLKLAGTGRVDVPIDVSETAYAVSLWFKTACTDCGIFSVYKGTLDHDRHVYLSNGNVCARVYSSSEIVCTSGMSYADNQWHHVVHTFGGTEGGQKIYVDGVLGVSGTKTASDFTWQVGVKIGFSNDAVHQYFTGSIDDVRLFDKALTQAQVRELANLPLFHMNFDQTNAWADVSSFKTPISDCVAVSPFTGQCLLSRAPSHDSSIAVHGSAASFDGTTHLNVPGGPTAPQLDLSGGRFTLAAWIYPRNHGDSRDTHAQGILGLNSGLSNAYPTLQRVGKKIRFSLGTGSGSAWQTPFLSGDVLTLDQWNHVALTLNKDEGKGRLYVNGELKGDPFSFAGSPSDTATSFDIGRSSNTATVKFDDYIQGEHGDGGLSCECIAGNDSEMCMAIDQQEAWNQAGGLCCTEHGSLNANRTFHESTTMVLWEDDNDPDCGSAPTKANLKIGNDDDTCQVWWGGTHYNNKGTSQVFTSNDASFTDRDYEFDSCGTGDFHGTLTNNSVPFYGSMDELQIYGQALDQDAIQQLYLDAATLLRLPLDEAPGAVAFEDLSLARVPASCAASGCPTSGTTGRINRAAQFAASKQNAISLNHSAANELVSSFTVAAWIRPNTIGTVQNIVSTARTKTNNGWGLRLNGSTLEFEPYGYGITASYGLGLKAGRWTHVVAVIDASYHVKFYVDNVVQEVSHGGPYGGGADTDDPLLVGATQATGATTPSQFFDGQIDDVWVFNTALSDSRVTQLYKSAPVLHMLFDDATGTTQFADNAASGRFGTCTKTATTDTCPLAGEGVRGQVGLAVQFDGVEDTVTVESFGDFKETTVSAWVYRTAATKARETIVSYKENSTCGFVLDLNDDATNHYPRFNVRVQPASGLAAWKSVTSEHTVPLNTWVHLAGTYDGNKIRLYQNGVLQVESSGTDAAGAMVNTCADIMTVGSRNSKNQHWFPGAIDEVQIYGRALTPGEMQELSDYQSAWVEGRESHNITVDSEAPTADLLIPDGSYLADEPIWVGVTANDPTSGVDKVELGAQKNGDAITWTTAVRCAQNAEQPEGAWCAQFDPPDADPQGPYTLYARATDRVGRTGSLDQVSVNVDDTAPEVFLDQVSYQRLDAQMSGDRPQTWVVKLSGYAKDPPVWTSSGNVGGSGVPADGVRVTLRDAEGKALGDAGQRAIVSNEAWSLDYMIQNTEPNGCFEVEVEAEDQVARNPGLDSYQVGRHTTTLKRWVVLDGSAPVVLLDQQEAIANGQMGSGTKTLGGEASSRPVQVQVDLTTADGADQTRVRLTCQHGDGAWYTLFDLQAGTLTADSAQHWEGEIHQGSACRVELTTTAPAAGVSGAVTVCREQLPGWTGDFTGSKTYDFVAQSDSCAAAGCPANPPVAGVQGADAAFRSVLPGSAFFNEAPLSGEVLHIPFEDIPSASSGLVREVSGAGVNGTCSGSTCPTLGQTGPSGRAAWFDGVDDNVQVIDDNRWDFSAGQDFTIAVWARPDSAQPDSRYTDHSIVEKWSASGGYPYVIRYFDQNDKTHPGKVVAARYQGTQPQPTIYSDRRIDDGRLHHLVFAKIGSALTLYIDGTVAGTTNDNTTGTTTNSSALFIGQRGNSQNHFAGMVDDLRIFNRGLTPAEVMALYTGSGPLLALSFEKPWATHGAALPDSSGWGHDATLQAGTTDSANKSVSGQVGSYALSFDGVDDYANVGSTSDLKLSSRGTLAAWIYPTTAKDSPILNREGEYEVYRYADGTIRWAFANTTPGWNFVNTGYVAQPNVWTHIGVVYDAGIVRTYANGALVHTYNGAGTIGDTWPTQNELWVGGRSAFATDRFGGSIDEVRIYQRALSAPEIADLYHAGWQAVTLPSGGQGAERTSWSASVPAGLEGSYQVEMRGRDVAAHAAAVSNSSLLWRGEADNLSPRVTLTKTALNSTTNEYTTVAEDYHLAQTGFSSPCGTTFVPQSETFRSPWYVGSTGDSQKLYRLTAVCSMPNTVTEEATACDSFGNCRTCDIAGNCTTAAAPAAAASPQQAERSLQRIEDSAVAGSGLPDLSGTFAPLAKPGNPGFVIRTPAAITTSHYYEPRTLDVVGAAITKRNPLVDRHALAGVQVAIGDAAGSATLSEPAKQRPYTVTWTLPWRLPEQAALPDGVSTTATITATDLAGRTTVANRTLVADVVKPAPVNLTLTSNGTAVEPGVIIRDTGPELELTWTSSSDGSGLGPYEAAWRVEDAYATTIQTSLHDPADTREAHLTAGEAQRISSGLASRDVHGNERRQQFGSVIVDGPLTPDYFAPLSSSVLGAGAGAEGWMDSGCSVLGADRRIARLGGGERWAAQQIYATWDHRALRLAWTGANWNGDGDLFIYLDTGPGGTHSTFTPYPVSDAGMTLTLPAELPADLVIWVQDGDTASLLRWNGSDWAVEGQLMAEQFRFDAARNDGQTDLYLPLEMLDIQAGAALGLLAFAVEEPAPNVGLRVWATLPLANPLNSSRINRRLPLAPRGSVWPLRHAYRWTALSDGVCPNGTREGLLQEQHNDAALQMTIESDPPTATASGVFDNLFWVSDPIDILGPSGTGPMFGFLRALRPPLPDGQAIAYTVSYRNEGNSTLEGAWLEFRAVGPLRLDRNRFDLGEISPGDEGSVTFSGTVDRSLSPIGLAAAVVRLWAASSGSDDKQLEWLLAARRVDLGAPEEMGLDAPAVMGPEPGWLRSYAYDESRVSRIDIEIVGPSGATSTLTCEAPGPVSTRWSCPWDPAGANGGIRPLDGDEYTVRIRATDAFGSPTGWSDPHTIRVDAQPPTVTLAAEASSAYPGRPVRGSVVRLIGDTLDNHAVGNVTVCVDGDACRTADVSRLGDSSSDWSHWLLAGGALDYVTKTVTIRATDRLGNAMEQALEVPVVFDNVAPALLANQILTQVPMSSTETVLSGTVGDSGPKVTVSVRMQPPHGDMTRIAAGRDGESWWFDLPADVPGQYTLWADAEDLAGNVTTVGPYTVDVTCTDATLIATRLTAEPVEGWPTSLTLTTVISNAGPDPLPAGITVDLGEGVTFMGAMTTTAPLESGDSQALSTVWAPDGARDYDVRVTVRQDAVLPYLPKGPLCGTPPPVHFAVAVRDMPLYHGWTLLSLPVSPSNRAAQVVQRGIDHDYSAILGYDGDLLAYYADRPQDSTLETVDALHGYWVRTLAAAGQPPPQTVTDESAATWRVAGEILPEDQPLPLAGGWNLASYLPRRSLTVTTALQGIEEQYASVLSFDRTALAYYPDLDPSYNTLGWMAPGYGYWISATQAITLQYPLTSITDTLPVTAMHNARLRLDPVRLAESAAGVRPTYEWMNFYGVLSLPDGTGVPTGTVVLAVDPQGVICGATATWEPGQYGLLACYADDPDTPEDEGASPGDTIRLVVGEGSPPAPGSWAIGEGTWTAHGARQQVPAGAPPELPNRSYLPLLLREEAPGNQARAPGPAPGSESPPANGKDASAAAG
jgi:Concanavalin A-like lectin/glucanases superfamily/Bacterial TSP3 repeat